MRQEECLEMLQEEQELHMENESDLEDELDEEEDDGEQSKQKNNYSISKIDTNISENSHKLKIPKCI